MKLNHLFPEHLPLITRLAELNLKRKGLNKQDAQARSTEDVLYRQLREQSAELTDADALNMGQAIFKAWDVRSKLKETDDEIVVLEKEINGELSY